LFFLFFFLLLLLTQGLFGADAGSCCATGASATKLAGILGTKPPEEMVWIPGGEFEMGAIDGDALARDDEKPRSAFRGMCNAFAGLSRAITAQTNGGVIERAGEAS